MFLFLSAIYLVNTPHVPAQNITTSQLQSQFACPGERITFTCEVQSDSLATLALAWSSIDFIGVGNAQLQFSASLHSPGLNLTSRMNQNTIAEFTALRNGSDGFRLLSTLNVTVSSNVVNPSVSCTNIGATSTETNSFTVLGMLAINNNYVIIINIVVLFSR